MRRTYGLVAAFGIFIGLVGCDQGTKRYAESSLRGKDAVPIVAGVVDLRYSQNRGVAFNVERFLPKSARNPLLFCVGSALFLLLFGALNRAGARLSPLTVGYAIVAAGAAGNLL